MQVAAAWRYPVKSFQGVAVDGLDVGPGGVRGDRDRALIDLGTGTVMSAKRTSALLQASADDDGMTLPDGARVAYPDPDRDARLSAWLGRDVELREAAASSGLAYQMTFDPPDDDAEYFDIPVPEGTFVDMAPVHLITTATLEHCRAARPDLDWDVRRFRPNLLVEANGEPFVEQGWAGRELRIGSAVVRVDQATVRCAMPLRAQPGGLERQPELYAAMNELNAAMPNHLGVYASIVEPGRVAVGDDVSLDIGGAAGNAPQE